MIGVLSLLGHKKLNLQEDYVIRCIDVNRIDAKMNDARPEGVLMKTVSAIAQYLAGLIFLAFGLNGFLHFIPLPPPTGVAVQFMGALYVSHYVTLIFGLQVVGGALLLANRFVPLALAILAPVIVNILSFHALMAPSGLPLAVVVTLLWTLIFVDVRSAFTGLLQWRLQPSA